MNRVGIRVMRCESQGVGHYMKLFRAMRWVWVAAAVGGVAYAAESMPPTSPNHASLMGASFTQTDGSELYQSICQGCHMPNGTGATGAAAYPALAKDPRLAAKSFPVIRVLNGSKAMPPFKTMLTDEQIVAVISYVRTHFGNTYKDKLTVDDVKALRK
jgi:mono/diheme cytochrome c family protein